jgi:hypothetical protein
MEMGMGNKIRNEMSTNWKWNGSKIVVEWKWNSNGMVTENILVKREFYTQICQQSTNMQSNQSAVASKRKTARARIIDRTEYEKIILKKKT